jgi:chorismate synthase
MASNSFGNIFRITTWGESHGKAIGVVIDGCPAGLTLDENDIDQQLALRAPGGNEFTSPRKEEDKAEILSGVFEDKTTGAPISIIIKNKDADSSQYDAVKNLLRPGHANYTYIEKYGCFDYRGGGRASARETACRVAAGAVAKKILAHYQIKLLAYMKAVGDITTHLIIDDVDNIKNAIYNSPIFCPDKNTAERMMQAIAAAKQAGDSLGGVIEFFASGLPAGLGDPVYEKLEANLAKAMLSLLLLLAVVIK